jgi:outer membrane protein assembly factor BamE (lipoprotein component of BamABCDE complex)
MSRIKSAGWILLLATVGLNGCLVGTSSDVHREGNYVADATLKSIEPGKTTATWVQATLGEPSERTQVEPKHEIWKYRYREVKDSAGYIFLIFGGNDKKVTTDQVFVEIEDGVVTKTWRG